MCTDTPGEFTWRAGPLLQAVQAGHWILLEDIDLAPMDVISVLIPLLESLTLSVPAHGNAVKASPGFQLFATQRYVIYNDVCENCSTGVIQTLFILVINIDGIFPYWSPYPHC